MTEPRQVLPGRTYLLTRRTAQRRFLLLPSAVVEQVFLYCLAFASLSFGLEIHGFCVLSNHYHLVVTDVEGKLPRFMHWLNVHVSKLLNVKYRRGENFWSDKKFSAVHLLNREDVLDKLVYTIGNPVSSWLVSRSDRWPGLVSLPPQLAGAVLHALRPEFFFRERKGGCPQQVDLELTKPPMFDDLSDEEFRELVAERLDEREHELREARRREGKGFLGRNKLRAQAEIDTPWTGLSGAASRGGITPRAACKDKWRRIERLEALVGFRQAYAVALLAWRTGNLSVIFPAGTYLMRVLHGVACAPT